MRRRVILRIVLALGAVLFSLLVAEGVLRAVGFHYDIAPDRVEFGAPDPRIIKLHRSDPELFWVDREYPARLAGARDRHPDIVFQGDSVTALGGFPELFVERLEEAEGAEVVGVSLAVSGWSSFQGLKQLERDVAPMRPDVVTLFYGWNDHWIGFGVADAQVFEMTSALSRFRGLRLSQLAFKAWLGGLTRDRSRWPVRVPPDDFRRNLARMVEVAREHGVVPVLLTAPSAHEVGREPPHLAARWIRDLDQLVPLHRRYVSVVREVASDEDAPLCDLASRFDALPAEEVRSRDFMADGIHLLPAGDERTADFLLDCFRNEDALAAVMARWTHGGADPGASFGSGAR